MYTLEITHDDGRITYPYLYWDNETHHKMHNYVVQTRDIKRAVMFKNERLVHSCAIQVKLLDKTVTKTKVIYIKKERKKEK